MYANRSVLGSAQTLSLSTEHLSQEQSLISIPPPMSNLHYDPPHLSRWQQATTSQRQLFGAGSSSSNGRSGSAVAQRNEFGRQRHSSKSSTLNDQFRALTLHSRNHCDPFCSTNSRPGILNQTTYELSDDLRAREIDILERRYGGRTQANRAARIIQAKYRKHRMRAEYARLRTDRRSMFRHTAVTSNAIYANDDCYDEVHHLASMEDLVINRAYLDWESEAVVSGGEGSLPDLSVEPKASRSSAPSTGSVHQNHGEVVEPSSQSCTNLAAPKNRNQRQQSSPGTATDSTSGFVSSPESCSSGSLVTENAKHQYHPEPPPLPRQFPDVARARNQPQQSQQNQQQQPVLYYLLDREEPLRLPPTQQQLQQQQQQQQQQLFVAVPMKSDQQYLKIVPQQQQHQQPQRYLTTQQSTSTTVLVRRSSTGSNSRQPPIWCTPDGKMYTLAYTINSEKPKAIPMQPNQSPHQQQQHQQAVFVTPLKKERLGSGQVLVKLQSQASSSPVFTPLGHRVDSSGPTPLSERLRKRLYRVCLNYFNKSPVKGIDMLIKFHFLEPSPRQIARFLLTRKGLSRSAIGELLGDMRHDLTLATSRQFIRELDFREKDVDEALRILMSCFRTPGESQKIVHLLTEFQSTYIEQNAARVKSQFRNTDSVMILSYAIVMLHTDMYSPNVRPSQKMTQQEFVKNLRGVDDGKDLDKALLNGIYERIRANEMAVAPDHTDQVRKIEKILTGPLRPTNLVLPQRRLVCYCRLFEVPDKTKRERPGAHQREIFLFNDLMVITKANAKRRKDSSPSYQVRTCISLFGTHVSTFETPHHPNGISLYHVGQTDAKEKHSRGNGHKMSNSESNSLMSMNAKTNADKLSLLHDLQECILETAEMDRVRLDDILGKQSSAQQQPNRLPAAELRHQASVPAMHCVARAQTRCGHNPRFCKCPTEPAILAAGANGCRQQQYPTASANQRPTYVLKTPDQLG